MPWSHFWSGRANSAFSGRKRCWRWAARPRFVVAEGPAGIGRTSLLDAFVVDSGLIADILHTWLAELTADAQEFARALAVLGDTADIALPAPG